MNHELCGSVGVVKLYIHGYPRQSRSASGSHNQVRAEAALGNASGGGGSTAHRRSRLRTSHQRIKDGNMDSQRGLRKV